MIVSSFYKISFTVPKITKLSMFLFVERKNFGMFWVYYRPHLYFVEETKPSYAKQKLPRFFSRKKNSSCSLVLYKNHGDGHTTSKMSFQLNWSNEMELNEFIYWIKVLLMICICDITSNSNQTEIHIRTYCGGNIAFKCYFRNFHLQ